MAAVITALVLARIWYVWTSDVDGLVFRITDDAYYYLNTARNIVLGYGVTFDRINPSNGFHPLWLLCLLPVYALSGSDLTAPIRVVATGLAVLGGITAGLLYRITRDWCGRAGAVFALAVLAHPLVANHLVNGLETALLILLLLLLVRAEQRWNVMLGEGGRLPAVVFGGLLGLIFLARLDAIFVVAAVLIAWTGGVVIRGGRRRQWQDLALGAGVAGALGLAYVVWNLAAFGHLTPISGAVKSSFPHLSFSPRSLTSPSAVVHGAVLLAFWMVAWLGRGWWSGGQGRFPGGLPLILPLFAGATVHFGYELLFTRWGVEWWHFASHVVPLLLFAAATFQALARRLRPAIAATLLVAAFAVSGASAAVEARLRGDHHSPWLRAAEWARAETAPESVFAMTDSGLFGYFSGRRTVNLDGVINGYAFQEALRDGRLGAYLRESRVSYLADYEVPHPVAAARTIRLRSGLHGGRGGELSAGESAEVYRSAPYVDYVRQLRGKGQVVFVIWDMNRVLVRDGTGRP